MDRQNVPASPSTLDESLDLLSFGDGSNVVKQIDEGMHPAGKTFIELIAKSRVSPLAQPFVDHINARAIQTGKFAVPVVGNHKLNAAESLVVAHQISQIAIKGESRNEFTKVLTGITGIARSGFRMFGNRRQTNYGNQVM